MDMMILIEVLTTLHFHLPRELLIPSELFIWFWRSSWTSSEGQFSRERTLRRCWIQQSWRARNINWKAQNISRLWGERGVIVKGVSWRAGRHRPEGYICASKEKVDRTWRAHVRLSAESWLSWAQEARADVSLCIILATPLFSKSSSSRHITWVRTL